MITTRLLAGTALITLAACGGGSTTVGDGFTSPFLGSTGTTSANGLAFADKILTISDADGQTVNVKVGYMQHDTGAYSIVFAEESLTPDDNVELTLGNGTITWNGSGYTLDGSGDWLIDSYSAGTYGDVINFYDYSGPEYDGMLVYGFETSPDAIANLTDTLIYQGYFEGWGMATDGEGNITEVGSYLGGNMTMTAIMSAGTVSGDIAAETYPDFLAGLEGDFVTVDMSFAGDIDGNGFQTSLSIDGCDAGFTCTGSGDISGVFFGPNAEETGGLGFVDLTVTEDGVPENIHNLETPAGFYATEPPV